MPQKTPHVALLIETSRSYGRGLLRGIQRYISEHGPWSVYLELRALDSKPPIWLRSWKGDGIIARTGSQAMADAVLSANIPSVELRASRAMPSLPFVGVDNQAVGRMVTDHFKGRGFRHFAVYGMATEEYFDERCRSFVEAVAELGYKCEEFSQGRQGEHPHDWEQQQLKLSAWIAALPKPIGVLTCTDQLGFWFLDACKRASIAVPEEVAVVACENDESLSAMATPPMSSVQFNAVRTGYEAAALLDRMMNGGARPKNPVLVPPLGIVVRQSSDIVAVEDKEVAAALQFIRENACQGIGIEEVLRAIPISRAALNQRMRKAVGRATKAEIVRVQLERVKQLLEETDLALSQIADRTGFRHPQYMAELFKVRFGVTPGAFRTERQAH